MPFSNILVVVFIRKVKKVYFRMMNFKQKCGGFHSNLELWNVSNEEKPKKHGNWMTR